MLKSGELDSSRQVPLTQTLISDAAGYLSEGATVGLGQGHGSESGCDGRPSSVDPLV